MRTFTKALFGVFLLLVVVQADNWYDDSKLISQDKCDDDDDCGQNTHCVFEDNWKATNPSFEFANNQDNYCIPKILKIDSETLKPYSKQPGIVCTDGKADDSSKFVCRLLHGEICENTRECCTETDTTTCTSTCLNHHCAKRSTTTTTSGSNSLSSTLAGTIFGVMFYGLFN